MSRPLRLVDAPSSPVMTGDDATALAKRIFTMLGADVMVVQIVHTSRVITRIANGRVLSSDDGEDLTIQIGAIFGNRPMLHITTNQMDDASLRVTTRRLADFARQWPGSNMSYDIPVGPRQLPATSLWKEPTVAAMASAAAIAVPVMTETVRSAGFVGAGFIGLMARTIAVVRNDGLASVSRETDTECSVTARAQDGTSSGWSGQASRTWTDIDPKHIAQDAVDLARRGINPVALEPGRRTAILSPVAVGQMLRLTASSFNAFPTDLGGTPLSNRAAGGNKIGLRIMDPRLTIVSDPADPAGGYTPFLLTDMYGGVPIQRTTWVERGVLKDLAYDEFYALGQGKPFGVTPMSMRVVDGNSSVDQMIASCKEGIYVNRFSNAEVLDQRTGMITAATRDGCFLVKDGKLTKSLKNFRILDSPFLFLNNVEALGTSARVPLGYSPPVHGEDTRDLRTSWPRPPMIVPPMMIRDFNFVGLSDAV